MTPPIFLALALAAGLAAPAGFAQVEAKPPALTASAPSWDATRLKALEAQLRAHPNVRAFVIERSGQVALQYYRADMTPSTRFNVASVTKSVVSLLVGIAIGKGAIASVDEPLTAFFPEHAQGPGADTLSRVTLRHLLTLTPGFDRRGLHAGSDYSDFERRMYAPGLLPDALGRRLVDAPGSRFYYSNIDTHLVALALSRRLKVPLAEFARDELFQPLGIEGATWQAGSDGMHNGASEIRLTVPDLLRIGRMMADGGRWQGRQVVPSGYVQLATSRQVPTDSPVRGPAHLWGYGFLWWTGSTHGDDLPAFTAAGWGGQFIHVVPALDLVVVTATDAVSREVAGRTAALIRDYAVPALTR